MRRTALICESFFIFLTCMIPVPRDTDHPGGAGQGLWIVPAHGIEFPSALYESNPGMVISVGRCRKARVL